MKTAKLLPILLILLPVILGSVTRTVKQDGTGDYLLIQAALDACLSGDTVLVYPGRYYENLVIGTSNITLRSLEATTGNPVYIDSTVVDGNNEYRCMRIAPNVQGVSVRGFALTNGFSTGGGGGIAVSVNSSCMLVNLKIFNNACLLGGGINIGAATVQLSGVEIYSNYSISHGGGVYAAAGGGCVNTITFDPVNRCSIYNNRAGVGQDIYIQNAVSDLNVYLDTFSVAEPSSYYAIYRPDGLDEYQIHFDILNAHHQEIDSDLYVSPEGDDTNDGLSAGSPLRSIHEAIYRIASNPAHNRSVVLAAGSYSRAANGQSFPIALKTHTVVQGSGMDNTLVIGDPHPLIPTGAGYSDVVFKTHSEPEVMISDLAITTINSMNSCAIKGMLKGSLNLSSVRIHDINPDHNSAIWVWLTNESDSNWDNVLVENIVTPDQGLVFVGGSMSGTISNSVFRNGLSTFNSASVGNTALVSITGDRYLRFENCVFSDLTMTDDDSNAIAISGVQFPQQSNDFSFVNCLFSNISSNDKLIYVGSTNNPNVSFHNCTFAGNSGNSHTLAVNGNVSIANSIFDNDTPYQIKISPTAQYGEYSTLNIDHSLIRDGYSGIQQAAGNIVNYSTSNLDTAPLFTGGANIHDPLYYTLSAASPCIDSGTPDISGLDLPPYDLAGNWRVWNGRIDMGCYEYGSEPWVSNVDPELPTPPEGIRVSVYPNPLQNTSRTDGVLIEFTLPKKTADTPVIGIYSIRGQKVKTIRLSESYNCHVSKNGLSNVVKQTGEFYSTIWNGKDDDNRPLASGTYLVKVEAGQMASTAKVTIIR